MIRMQIVERTGAGLHKALTDAMRHGELRTFQPRKRGRQIHHIAYPGWMNWQAIEGVIHCEILSPRKPGQEWQFCRALVGRLANRYADRIESINIQFPEAARRPPARRGRKRSRR